VSGEGVGGVWSWRRCRRNASANVPLGGWGREGPAAVETVDPVPCGMGREGPAAAASREGLVPAAWAGRQLLATWGEYSCHRRSAMEVSWPGAGLRS